MTIVWYVTAHGHGHLARSCDIIRELLSVDSDSGVYLVGDIPPPFVAVRIARPGYTIRHGVFDVGLLQLDSVRGDRPKSLQLARRLIRDRARLIAQEVEYLREVGADLVVTDIPSIPLEAASRLGIPSIAVGNFSWDWIYKRFAADDAEWESVAAMYQEGYAKARLLIRLPFHEDMKAFRCRRVDIGLVATAGRPKRAEIAEAFGADPSDRWVMIALAQVAWGPEALNRMARLNGVTFLTLFTIEQAPPNFRVCDLQRFSFMDVLASSDVVLSKPGYGIVSDCVVNAKPLICVERHDFPEAEILMPAIRRHLHHAFLSQEAFYAGNIEPALVGLEEPAPCVEPVPGGGASDAARLLIELADAAKSKRKYRNGWPRGSDGSYHK